MSLGWVWLGGWSSLGWVWLVGGAAIVSLGWMWLGVDLHLGGGGLAESLAFNPMAVSS